MLEKTVRTSIDPRFLKVSFDYYEINRNLLQYNTLCHILIANCHVLTRFFAIFE